jgi:hypothetical protein
MTFRRAVYSTRSLCRRIYLPDIYQHCINSVGWRIREHKTNRRQTTRAQSTLRIYFDRMITNTKFCGHFSPICTHVFCKLENWLPDGHTAKAPSCCKPVLMTIIHLLNPIQTFDRVKNQPHRRRLRRVHQISSCNHDRLKHDPAKWDVLLIDSLITDKKTYSNSRSA